MTAPEAIRLSNEESKRKLTRTVSVEVTIRPEELASTLTRDEVVRLCARHNIELKGNSGRGGNRYKINRGALADAADRLAAGDVEEALIRLERVLPWGFRHLSGDAARFYRDR